MRLATWFILGSSVAACVPKEPPPEPDCASPAPPAGLNPTRDVEGALRYARQLEFFPGAAPYGERRALTQLVQPGPVAERRFALAAVVEIQPERCSHVNDTTALTGGSGRIVARIIASEPYPKLGLPKDTSYLWIDSLTLRGAEGRARGVIVSGAGEPLAIRRVRIEYHPEVGARRGWPEGRLLFRPEDDEVWESCVLFGCCYLEGGQPGGPN
jgi:hypothetical protein